MVHPKVIEFYKNLVTISAAMEKNKKSETDYFLDDDALEDIDEQLSYMYG